MNIRRQYCSTLEEYVDLLESLDFTFDENTYKMKYNPDETETWTNIGWIGGQNPGQWCYIVFLYNNGILLTRGTETEMDSSPYFIAIAPESGDDTWLVNVFTHTNDTPTGIANTTRYTPTFSCDAIELSDYYDTREEKMYNNLYYMVNLPYRNFNYGRQTSDQSYHFYPLSDHIQNYPTDSSYPMLMNPCPYVEVDINGKIFLLWLGDWGSQPLIDGATAIGYNGAKRTLALRLS